jgi:PAS domain S-box-containing protein
MMIERNPLANKTLGRHANMRESPTIKQAVAAAVLAVLAGWLARILFAPMLGERIPFITFFPAIFFLAWWGGWRPTLLATLLSVPVLAYFVLQPTYSFRIAVPEYQAGVLLFVLASLAIGWLGEQLHAARRTAELHHQEAIAERERLRVTLASIGDAVVVTDERGHITSLNAVAESLTGWTTDQARGKPLDQVFRIVNEETRQAVEDPCAKVLRTGAIVGLANHTLLICRDGSERPIDDSAAPILDGASRVRGVIVVFRDVSENRAAEKALRRSQRELSDFFDNAALPIHSIGPDGTIVRANQAALDMLGYSSDEYVGHHIAEFHADKQAIDDILIRLSRGQILHNYEAQLRRKDGTMVDALITSSVLWEEGKFIHTRCFTRDITDRKRSEEAMAFLASTTTTLAALTDHKSALQEAVRITVPFLADWCVVYAVSEYGTISHQAFAHSDPEKEQRLATMLANNPLDWNSPTATVRALRTGKPQLMEELTETVLDTIAQNEEQREIMRELEPRSVISVPLRIRDRILGVMSFVACASRNYTEADLKFAENIADRTATAIDNAQLYQAVKDANRQKDEFLAMLAHELRNPLAAIRYAGALGQISPGQPMDELFAIIDRQTQNLAHLIDDLLDVSRISRDKVTLRKEHIDVADIVQRAVATVRPLIEQKRHRLTLDVAKQAMPLFADPTRAEQILANLLTNAAKYTPEEGRVNLRAYPEHGHAVIKVIDTGVGLPPEMLVRVFDLFAQADRTLDRSQGGLGIGLTVARKLAEMHGGTITAASDGLGTGSTFTVRLPLCEYREPQFSTEPRETRAGEAARMRILVVDDNRDTATSGALLLKMLGHEVEVAFDGPSALEMARTFQPEAMLLDIGLPGMTGYEVAKKLRDEGFQKTRIVAVSGYGQPEDRQRSQEAGCDDHLVKPVDQAALLSILSGDDSK